MRTVKSIRSIISAGLSVVFCMTWFATGPAFSQTLNELDRTECLLGSPHASAASYEEDILLIMPAVDADRDEVNDAIKRVHGRILTSIDEGRLRVLRVRTEKGKLTETEQQLSKDRHFSAIQRNYLACAQGVPSNYRPHFTLSTISSVPVNDPNFNQEWYLGAVHAPQTWATAMGQGVTIAIFDSGCNFARELRLNKGFDATSPDDQYPIDSTQNGADPASRKAINDYIDKILPKNIGANADYIGHGTEVATTAAAILGNGINTAGVAPGALVEPVRISKPDSVNFWATDDWAIVLGLQYCKRFGIKIVNISYNFQPPFSLSNTFSHRMVQEACKDFHEYYNGLVFVAAGDYGTEDLNKLSPYMIVVSAIDRKFGPANSGSWATTYGKPIWFCAPGTNIACSGKDGSLIYVDGTSFASSICAGIAALVWSANPSLKNTQVEACMVGSCKQLDTTLGVPGKAGGGFTWSPIFGYGLPDADKAVKIARGTYTPYSP